jgi:hypothetical protein
MVHAALLLLMLEAAKCETSFHHQPEAQHPKSSAIHKIAGRLPHLSGHSRHGLTRCWFGSVANDPKRASLWRCIKRLDAYSITLSARESSVSGTLRPSA